MKKFLSILLLSFLLAAPTMAQEEKAAKIEVDAVTRVVESITSPEVNYREVNKSLSQTEEALKSNKITVSEISDTVKFLSETRTQLRPKTD